MLIMRQDVGLFDWRVFRKAFSLILSIPSLTSLVGGQVESAEARAAPPEGLLRTRGSSK
jgi:hypothetical protein